MYRRKQYIQCSVLSEVSGTHWGPGNASPADKQGGGLMYIENVKDISKITQN